MGYLPEPGDNPGGGPGGNQTATAPTLTGRHARAGIF